jgi:DNA (cytosine-5)-methyltransferase 1
MVEMRLLDLFCKAGGAGMGYHRAGFEVVGVDVEPQPHYPFEFIQADALTFPLNGFDVIHASPPCKRFSALKAMNFNLAPAEDRHADLLTPTRARLKDSSLPYVIENVVGAPLMNPVTVCGSFFGLAINDPPFVGYLRRHRLFESNLSLQGTTCRHHGTALGVSGHGISGMRITGERREGGIMLPAKQGKQLMGIDWMNRDELAQAIPPAYTEWIGRQLQGFLR